MWKRMERRTQENVQIIYEFKPVDADGAMSSSTSLIPPFYFNCINISQKLDENNTVSRISVGFKQSKSFKHSFSGGDTSDWDAPICHPDFINKKEHFALISICKLLLITQSSVDWHDEIIELGRLGPDYTIELVTFLRFVNEHSAAMDAEMCRQLYLDSGAKRPPSLVYSEIQSMARENAQSAEAQAISYQNDGYPDALYFLAEHFADTHNPTAAFETYMMVPRSSVYYREAQGKCCNIILEKLASENPDTDLKHKYVQQLLAFAVNCGNERLATSCFAKLSGKSAGEPQTPIALDANTIVSLALEARALRLEIQKIQSSQRTQRSIFSSLPLHEEALLADSSFSSLPQDEKDPSADFSFSSSQ